MQHLSLGKLSQRFFDHILLDPYFLWMMIFFVQNFFGPNHYFDPKVFSLKILLDPKSFGTQQSFGTKKFLDPKFFWNQKFLDLGFYLPPNSFQPKILMGPILFWTKNFFNLRILDSKCFWT